jgi:branched-chain amino acid aminotransferase
MLEIDWDVERGWHAPRIIPFQNISMHPAATCLHYAIECFEGMKAYKDSKGNIRLFRPDKNMERFNNSMVRLAMPPVNGNDGFLECIKELIRLDESWVPDKEGYSLYIRPTAIGTGEVLGVHASEKVRLFCILSPVGPYYKSGFKPVKLYADHKNVRAWPGGVGNAKVGGNYAPTIYPSQLAAKEHGCSQILWLYGEDHQITEVGAMNIFFLFKKDNGKMELITPPLTRGDILPGVTRASVLEIAREMGDVEVSERFLTMKEIMDHNQKGTVSNIYIPLSFQILIFNLLSF